MEEIFFKNAGKRLKAAAVVTCVVIWIAALVVGVVFISKGGKWGGIIGLGILAGGFFGGWLGNIMLYGKGEMFENIYDIRNKLCGEDEDEDDYEDDEEDDEDDEEDDGWKCSKCGNINPGYFTYCMQCRTAKPGYEEIVNKTFKNVGTGGANKTLENKDE